MYVSYTASDAFLEALWEAGVEYCFVNLGSDHPAVMESFAKNKFKANSVKVITCPTEMVALSMADGYARRSGKAQAVIVHVDLGTQALVCAVHNTHIARSPVLIFAGLTPATIEGEQRGSRTEFVNFLQYVPDQSAIVRQYCRYTQHWSRAKKRVDIAGYLENLLIVHFLQALGLPDTHFTHIFITFSMMFFPKSLSALSEAFRMLKPGGVFATATWKKPSWFAVVRTAFATDQFLPPFPPDSQVSAAISKDGQWDDERWIKTAFQDQGFVNTKIQIVTKKSGIHIKDFTKLNRGTVKVIMENFWNQEEREKYAERAHVAITAYLAKEYPSGYAEWDWTAILATGSKPA